MTATFAYEEFVAVKSAILHDIEFIPALAFRDDVFPFECFSLAHSVDYYFQVIF